MWKKQLMCYCLKVGSRSSPLARAQVTEVLEEIRYFHKDIMFDPIWIETTGDLDRTTSLKELEKTDFFTKEIDIALLQKNVRIAIHSAKDLPEALAEGLSIVAITAGRDPRDMLVGNLFPGAVVGVSSKRREDMIKGAVFVQIRGTIEERLALLDKGSLDALVVPEAALLRLNIDIPRKALEGETAPLQGQLAIIARSEDREIEQLFEPLDVRKKTIYLGLDPRNHPKRNYLTHCPLLKIDPFPLSKELENNWMSFTVLLVTSQSTARWIISKNLSLNHLKVICVGPYTASVFKNMDIYPYIAREHQAEGIIDLLPLFRKEKILYLHSLKARDNIKNYLLRERFDFCALPIYSSSSLHLKKPFAIEEFDEFFFTSPSTVEAFIKVFKKLPKGKILRALGPITKEVLLCHTNSLI